VADILTRKAQHNPNTIAITKLNLLTGLENLDVQLVSHGKASKNINGSNSFKLAPTVLQDLGPTSVFVESMELPAVDVVKILVEKFT